MAVTGETIIGGSLCTMQSNLAKEKARTWMRSLKSCHSLTLNHFARDIGPQFSRGASW